MVGKRSSFSLLTFVILLSYILEIENNDIFNGQTSKPVSYTVVKPQLIRRWKRNANIPKENKADETDHLAYTLNINDNKHILYLKKNKDFLSQDFVQYSHDKSGSPKTTYPKLNDHCYYHGKVKGHDDSLVALSTCSGLRGVIIVNNESYGIEPAPPFTANKHLLYHLKHSHSEAFACGVTDEDSHNESHYVFDPAMSLTALIRRKRNLPQTRYVELALVADNLRYKFKKENESAVREEMVELANLLDGYYKQLNIRVVLVALEIFKTGNPFDVEGSAGEVLGRFMAWRKETLLPKKRNDASHLIVGRPSAYRGGILGMAFVGTVCSVASSGGINVFSDNSLPYFSTVVAHELGHNLGMNHDNGRCSCNGGSCIMDASATGSTSFSMCSGADFERLVLRGGGVCLKNQPLLSDVVNVAKCGNGILEEGEQCDCGSPEVCTNKCCDAATCKFTRGSSCAQGSCCNNCQVSVSGTPCRSSVNSCDLPEFCNGKSAFCSTDHYIMDGQTCESNAAYCYEGRCQTYDYQCKHLFEKGATKAADICFQHANTKGDLFGNCGITSTGAYIKCSVSNAMCGKVQCTNVDTNNPPPGAQVSIQVIDGSSCVNADFNLGSDVLDPAYVNEGSLCDKGKACIDFKCVNATALLPQLNCDAQNTCNGRGWCNDQGHCHCNDGWAPPLCDRSGRGGSIDSGPAQIDYSLRNGLLIFFLLVIPILVLLVLVLLYVFKQDTLKCVNQSCATRHRSHNAANGQANSKTDVPANPTAQPHRHGPPTQTITPDPALEQTSRNGDLYPWNTESASVPNPLVHQQGPGVPRPIPSKQITH
ncbi:disintegrin and metalloproteinase domain-containing protein 9 [Osmerus mordax]|uniref:disintegrin and metalloproteinase domain-containing protein 9 n=1 Tax=Osmerus mordax TaxID=8014 RepID=UPI0035106CA1